MTANQELGELVERVKSGDIDAFDELYRKTCRSVFFHVQKVLNNPQDIENAVSETYLRTYQNLDQLSKPELFQSWVDRTATYVALDMVPDDRYRNEPSLDDEFFFYKPVMAESKTPDRMLSRKEEEEILAHIIDSLPEVQRTGTIMKYYDEMSIPAITKAMGCSEETVKSRLNYAQQNIEKAVKEEEKRGIRFSPVSPVFLRSAILRLLRKEDISRNTAAQVRRTLADECGYSIPASSEPAQPAAETKAPKKTEDSTEKAAKPGTRVKAGKATTAKTQQNAVASTVTKKGVAGKVIMAILLVVILLGGAMIGGAVYQQKTGTELPIPEPITKMVSQVLPNKETVAAAPAEELQAANETESSPQPEALNAPEPEQTPEPVEITPEVPADPMAEYLADYEPVFDMYRAYYAGIKLPSNNTDYENLPFLSAFPYGEFGIGETEMYSDFNSLGYLLQDISGDGIPELIIGSLESPQDEYVRGVIYGLFTLKNDYPARVLASGARSRFRLYPDNLILNDGSGGASSQIATLHRFNGTGKEFVYALIMQQPYYYEVTAERENLWQPAEGDTMLSEGEFRTKYDEMLANVIDLDLNPLPSPTAANQQGEAHAGEIPADLTKEQLSLYRQFLLRGDLMKMKGYNLDTSQLRYRFYDIDEDGISELYFVTPSGADSLKKVIGILWLDKNNFVHQDLSCSGNAMIGTVWMNGMKLEAKYTGDAMVESWFLRDPKGYKNPDISLRVGTYQYDPEGIYDFFPDGEYQITKEEFPQFYQQVDMIVGNGPKFDSIDQTISYEELIGNEILDPEITEVIAVIDWQQNTQLPSDRTLTFTSENSSYTLPFSNDAAIRYFGEEFDIGINGYGCSACTLDEFTERNRVGGRNAIVQIKNGEIIAVWMNPTQWG